MSLRVCIIFIDSAAKLFYIKYKKESMNIIHTLNDIISTLNYLMNVIMVINLTYIYTYNLLILISV
jgi:hypothetical protein